MKYLRKFNEGIEKGINKIYMDIKSIVGNNFTMIEDDHIKIIFDTFEELNIYNKELISNGYETYMSDSTTLLVLIVL